MENCNFPAQQIKAVKVKIENSKIVNRNPNRKPLYGWTLEISQQKGSYIHIRRSFSINRRNAQTSNPDRLIAEIKEQKKELRRLINKENGIARKKYAVRW